MNFEKDCYYKYKGGYVPLKGKFNRLIENIVYKCIYCNSESATLQFIRYYNDFPTSDIVFLNQSDIKFFNKSGVNPKNVIKNNKKTMEKQNYPITPHPDLRKPYASHPNCNTQQLSNQITPQIEPEHISFKSITNNMNDLYERKNSDYGNAFDQSLDDYGLTAAAIRLNDKLNRFKSLISKPCSQVKDESIDDTLIDLANYAIMTILWRNK